jgi:hypothetical protein
MDIDRWVIYFLEKVKFKESIVEKIVIFDRLNYRLSQKEATAEKKRNKIKSWMPVFNFIE